MEIAIYIIAGLIVGALIGFLVARSQRSKLETAFAVLQANKEHVEAKAKEDLQEVKDDMARQLKQQQEYYQRELEAAKANWLSEKQTLLETKQQMQEATETHYQRILAAKEEEYKNVVTAKDEEHRNAMAAKDEEHKNAIAAQEKRHDEAVESMKAAFGQTIENLKANMKAATEDMLKTRQEEFSTLSQRNIKGIVDPLNETIAKMKEAMEGYSKEQSEFSGTMKTNLDTIIKQTETARQSAVELTTALKHDSKVQGDYGEAILDEILSRQGFTEGIHYELQYVMKDDEGRALRDEEGVGLRPDVLFHIDTKRDVIIDSKINLTDFINFANATTPDERKMHLERHVRSIEKQVQLLSQKNYFKYHKNTNLRMDYVIMFVPISAAWWEAMRHKPSLWREAMENNVYIADEQTLFAALRIIKLTWTQIAQVSNQKEIFELVNEMIDRVGQFMKSYTAIGTALKSAHDAYVKAEEKLTPGGQSILTTTAKLLKKGAQDSKKNPVAKFVDVDDVEQLPEPEPMQEDE